MALGLHITVKFHSEIESEGFVGLFNLQLLLPSNTKMSNKELIKDMM